MSESKSHQPVRNVHYPAYDQPILKWYAGCYETVFVAFHPFFRFNNAVWNDLDAYPDNDVIKRYAVKVGWHEMQARSGIAGDKLLNLALLTSIGALHQRYMRPDLSEQLTNVCESDHIVMPCEGRFEPTMDRDIVRAFHLAGYEYAVFGDEFVHNSVVKPLAEFTTESPRMCEVWPNETMMARNIYSVDQRLLFTVDWDSFFTLICSNDATVRSIVDAGRFEGFYCDATTYHHWWLEDAIE